MYTPFQLLNSGNIQNIQQIPIILNGTNVNDVNNNLNIFEALCDLIPNQQDQNVKNVLENTVVQLLERMISIPETNWDKKDGNGNTIFEWGIWSGSSKIMNVFHTNQQITGKFIQIEKAQIQNFTRVLKSNHLASTFQNEQIDKFKQIGLDINVPTTPFILLNTGQIQNIISIPKALNKDNVNELNNSKLNIFEAIQKIISSPTSKWATISEMIDVLNVRKFSSKTIRQLSSGSNRIALSKPIGPLNSAPQRIESVKKIETYDTHENRFVKSDHNPMTFH
jgi:hypothetical protein